jgi:hypothetical protein
VLRTKDLASLRKNRDPTKWDIRTEQRTLQLLWSEGYVHRIPYLDLEQEKGGATYAYGLRDKGVKEYGGKAFDEHSKRTLDHELAISQSHVSLGRFCAANRLLLSWQQQGLKKMIHPDAYFSITDPKKTGSNTNHFFLEIERAKIGNYKDGEPSIARKLKRYYDYYNTPGCEEAWGFRTYRVVTLLRNDERRNNLLRAMQADLNHRMFWLGVESNHTGDFRTPRGDTFSFADFR